MNKPIGQPSPSPRPDYPEIQKQRGDHRPIERICAHYLLERQLAERLRSASSAERSSTYTEVYAQLFQSLPDHPQHTAERGGDNDNVSHDLRYLPLASAQDAVFLEIGCGDAELSFAAARKVRRAYGLDVTDELVDRARAPANFQFLKTAGTNIDLPDASVDIAYSNQLMEHLHPDDAECQLKEVVRVLRPGGTYYCRTPNRVTGPHDVSCYFDSVATCFHLREYDYASMHTLFRRAGFSKVRFFVYSRGQAIALPYWLARTVESAIGRFPSLARSGMARRLMGLNVTGIK